MRKKYGIRAALILLTLWTATAQTAAVYAETTETTTETSAVETTVTEAAETAPPEETPELTETETEPPETEAISIAAETAAPTDAVTRMQFEELPDGTLRLTEFKWESNENIVSVPETVDGKTVTVIGQSAFRYCYADSVALPNSITAIEDEAFEGCAYIKNMIIPSKCESIGYMAFADCDLLESVLIGDSVSYIGYMAFDGTPFYRNNNDDLIILGDGILYAYNGDSAELTLPLSVKTIGPFACSNHPELKKVTIPDSVKRIQDCAFDNCEKLSEVNVSGTLDELAGDAFVNTKWYQESKEDYLMLGDLLVAYRGSGTVAEVPEGVRVISESAFEMNAAVTTVKLPDTVEEVRRAAFYRCSSLQVVTLGDNVQQIGDLAFYGCETLNYLRLGHQLASIGEYAFAGCPQLEEVYLPDTLTEIGNQAFGYMYDLNKNDYVKMKNNLTIYANSGIAQEYCAAEDIQIEPLPDVENTEPAPEVTTVAGMGNSAGNPAGAAWMFASGIGGLLVIGGSVHSLRKKK